MNEFKVIMRAGPAQAARVLTRATAKGLERQRLQDEQRERNKQLKQQLEKFLSAEKNAK